MQITPVGQVLPVKQAEPGKNKEAGGVSFSEMFDNALKKLNDSQVKADNLTHGLITGEIEDIHQVTIAMQEAKLTMELAVEIRNKVIEAYQEISRMQV